MPLVITEDRGAIRHVVLNRPDKRNAFNFDLVRATGEALTAAAADPAVRCVVIRGEGAVFSSGMDVKELASLSGVPERLREFRRECILAWNLAEEMTKPTIAQIHGACFGGAFELALACDLRVVADDARLSIPEVRLGLVPDVGGSSRLPAIVGLGRAKELIMTGREFDADEAYRNGFANRISPASELDETTQQLVDELLLALPVPQGLAKRIMDASARPALSTTLELEVTAQEVCVASMSAAMRAATEA
ncbi:MAG: enoyl-CoA hydratase/isomerase family protein [Actinobacteria bacterium]|nr:enoyl-CoA hydratase/isomerase family protein [Actinomycetota bacterium]